jgi:hypothetical protein
MHTFTYTLIAAETVLKLFEFGKLSTKSGKEAYIAVGAATGVLLYKEVQKTNFDPAMAAIAIDSLTLLVLIYAALTTYMPKTAGKYDAKIIDFANSKWGVRFRLLMAAIAILG